MSNVPCEPGHEPRLKSPSNARHTLVRMEAAGARLGRRVVPDGSSAENSL